MQFLDPWLKGRNAAGCLFKDLSGRNLSGSNSSASGPHTDLDRCMAKGPTTAPIPAGNVTPQRAGNSKMPCHMSGQDFLIFSGTLKCIG